MNDKSEKPQTNTPVFQHDVISLIATGIAPGNFDLFVGGTAAARDIALLREHNIAIVINCAVNLDINYVIDPNEEAEGDKCAHGTGPIRVFKLGLVDGPGNAEDMILAGYFLLDSATRQRIPDKKSYPNGAAGNVLVHCRGGRSRSTALAALFLHLNQAQTYPTLDSAVEHVRDKRGLHPDEWFSAPKPMLLEAAQRAAEKVRLVRA